MSIIFAAIFYKLRNVASYREFVLTRKMIIIQRRINVPNIAFLKQKAVYL
jgi:hypothetical protein